MPNRFRLLFLVLCMWLAQLQAQPVVLKHGHAHNDYAHRIPLMESLQQGFTSIEVDVYLHKGALKVSHLPVRLSAQKTIAQLYLQPLDSIARTRSAWYGGYAGPLTLMIDFKTEPAATYAALLRVLEGYKHLLQPAEGLPRLHILISGRAPLQQMKHQQPPWASIDADMGSLEDKEALVLLGRVSERWGKHFRWKGKGAMPQQELEELRQMVQQAHAHEKPLRFYGAPNRPAAWKLLLDEGVDYINTDKPAAFQEWFAAKRR